MAVSIEPRCQSRQQIWQDRLACLTQTSKASGPEAWAITFNQVWATVGYGGLPFGPTWPARKLLSTLGVNPHEGLARCMLSIVATGGNRHLLVSCEIKHRLEQSAYHVTGCCGSSGKRTSFPDPASLVAFVLRPPLSTVRVKGCLGCQRALLQLPVVQAADSSKAPPRPQKHVKGWPIISKESPADHHFTYFWDSGKDPRDPLGPKL